MVNKPLSGSPGGARFSETGLSVSWGAEVVAVLINPAPRMLDAEPGKLAAKVSW